MSFQGFLLPAFECTKDKKLLRGEYLRWLLPLQSKWKSASSPFLFETFLKSTLIFDIANISGNESQSGKSAPFILHKLWNMDKSWFEITLVKVFENIWYCWGSKKEKGQKTLAVVFPNKMTKGGASQYLCLHLYWYSHAPSGEEREQCSLFSASFSMLRLSGYWLYSQSRWHLQQL